MQPVALVEKTKIITRCVILSINLSDLTLSCWVVSFCGRVSIIMLQKVAATIKKVAADLCFMACEVR